MGRVEENEEEEEAEAGSNLPESPPPPVTLEEGVTVSTSNTPIQDRTRLQPIQITENRLRLVNCGGRIDLVRPIRPSPVAQDLLARLAHSLSVGGGSLLRMTVFSPVPLIQLPGRKEERRNLEEARTPFPPMEDLQSCEDRRRLPRPRIPRKRPSSDMSVESPRVSRWIFH